MSFLRRQESIMPPNHWIPAFAGMTEEVRESQTEVVLKVIPENLLPDRG